MGTGRVSTRSELSESTEPEPVIVPFRRPGDARHACLMALRTIAMDLSAAGVLLSLISIVLFAMFGVAISLLTVARGRRRTSQGRGHSGIWPGFADEELAAIDEDLERITLEERAALPG